MKHARSKQAERLSRIDKLLVDRGLAESRTKAQALVMAGVILVNEQRVEKPSDTVAPDAEIRIKGGDDPAVRYVGRGGLKLEAALREFAIDVAGFRCLDVGASTGGFTDCLLQRGAKNVTAIDVGHNQIDWRLRTDASVEVREGINARYLKPDDFAAKFDLVVMDVSFISATKILPAIVPLLKETARLITLIKPQFEVGRGEVGKGGIVRDPEKHARVIEEVNSAAQELGLRVRKVIESPIHGADGNVEFLAFYEKMSGGKPAFLTPS
jgi:23S rRNA (cytidine1920-2'-O)/16S rRNA (cytidine1409-2'-O)-methyltransferase